MKETKRLNNAIKQFSKAFHIICPKNETSLKIEELLEQLKLKTNKEFTDNYYKNVKKLAYQQKRPNSEFIIEKLALEIRNY